ncbi:MAG: peptidase S1 [Planctomycetes bacterium]|nr:peptidase S1 [Planctomycetota bacterium]
MKKFAVRRLALVLGTAAVVVALFASRAATQDPTLEPTYGSVKLKAGFTPDPYVKKLVAGGPIKTNLGDVAAFVAKAPDFQLEYTAGKLALTIHVEAEADTTLLINLPDGKWIANDDQAPGNLNPLLKFDKPQSGRYDIWVGTFGKDTAPAVLKITEVK